MVTIAGASVRDAVFSPDGKYLYVASGGTITVYSSSTGQNLTSWTVGSQLGAFDVSADGRYIVAVERTAGPTTGSQWDTRTDYYIYRLDTVTGNVQTYTHHETGYDGPFADISYLADGTVLLTQNFLGSGWVPLTTLDLDTGIFTAAPGSYAQDGTLSATPDDRFVAFSPHNISDAPIFYYTTGTGVTASHQGYADGVSGYNSGVQAISPNGALVVEGVGMNVYNANLNLQFSLMSLYPELSYGLALAFSPDGGTFYMLNSARSTVYALSTADWSLTAGYAVHVTLGSVNPYGDGLTASQDGRYLSIIGSDGVEIIDLATVPSVPGTAGADTLTNDTTPFVYGYGGADTISVTGNVEVVRAGAGDDRISFSSPATSNGAYGSYSIIDAGTGSDTLDVSALTAPVFTSTATGFSVTAGAAKTFAVSGVEHVQLGAGNDSFTLSSNTTLTIEVLGGAGNDTFQGGLRMALRGEAGNDTFLLAGSSGAPTNGTIDGGAGIDRIQLNAGFTADLSAGTADSGSAHFTLLGIEDVTVTVGGLESHVTGDDHANTLVVNAYLDTGAAGVTFYGLGGGDVLTGSAGQDALYGGNGNDILAGRAGNDTLDGGAGLDAAVFSGDHGAYTLTVQDDMMQVAGPDGTDTLTGIERLQFADGTYELRSTGLDAPQLLSATFGAGAAAGGWSDQRSYPRTVADVDGDGRPDLVGFGSGGVYISLVDESGAPQPAYLAMNYFGADPAAGGWSDNRTYPRALADIDGDGRADLVGFGAAGVYAALATEGGAFGQVFLAKGGFGADPAAGGWSDDRVYPRMLADVNGDGMADVVGFGDGGVFVSLATGGGSFAEAILGSAGFGAGAGAGGWNDNDVYTRTLADVNGDGRADVVGFGSAGTYVSFAREDGTFVDPFLAFAGFGSEASAGGWTSNDRYTRTVGDMDGDGNADLVGFGDGGVHVAHGDGEGGFASAELVLAAFGAGSAAGGWSSQDLYPRLLADLNGDGAADIVGFGDGGVVTALSASEWALI